jgi:hypothetical protein
MGMLIAANAHKKTGYTNCMGCKYNEFGYLWQLIKPSGKPLNQY